MGRSRAPWSTRPIRPVDAGRGGQGAAPGVCKVPARLRCRVVPYLGHLRRQVPNRVKATVQHCERGRSWEGGGPLPPALLLLLLLGALTLLVRRSVMKVMASEPSRKPLARGGARRAGG